MKKKYIITENNHNHDHDSSPYSFSTDHAIRSIVAYYPSPVPENSSLVPPSPVKRNNRACEERVISPLGWGGDPYPVSVERGGGWQQIAGHVQPSDSWSEPQLDRPARTLDSVWSGPT